MNHFKFIQEALPVLRPGDVIRQQLSNKFAFVDILNTDGSFTKNKLMGLDNRTIYSYDLNWEYIMSRPNVENTMWCMNHSENGLPYHYVHKICDNRKLKKAYRKIQKLINHDKERN
jgi:hypothetical protein